MSTVFGQKATFSLKSTGRLKCETTVNYSFEILWQLIDRFISKYHEISAIISCSVSLKWWQLILLKALKVLKVRKSDIVSLAQELNGGVAHRLDFQMGFKK